MFAMRLIAHGLGAAIAGTTFQMVAPSIAQLLLTPKTGV
jgi:hypothetical protein